MAEFLRNTGLWLRALRWHETYWKVAILNTRTGGGQQSKGSGIGKEEIIHKTHKEFYFVFKAQFNLNFN